MNQDPIKVGDKKHCLRKAYDPSGDQVAQQVGYIFAGCDSLE
jgi:hypothetical protein